MEVRLPLPHVPPLWREGLLGLEAASLLRSPVWRGTGLSRGEDRPVLLIPGFMAGDNSLGLMTHWLRGLGYRTRSAGIRANIDCSASVTDALEERLEEMHARSGQRVAIIGQSRGGIIARALAVRRPDLVSGIVTLGSPTKSMLHVHPVVLGSIGVVGLLGSLHLRQAFTMNCLRGECCLKFRDELRTPPAEEVGFVSIHSKHDGIVDWRACVDPFAQENVEVRSSHCGMSVNAAVYRHVAEALAGFADVEAYDDDIRWLRAA
jgi:pimeloyl-ACP methyl ester carboxylesterase